MTNPIVSIQKITVTIAGASSSNTGSISSVTAANSIIEWQSYTSADTSDPLGNISPVAVITNGTTITCTRGAAGASAVTVYITITEYAASAFTSIQQGSVSLGSGVTSADASISSVTTSRSAVRFCGYTASSGSDNFAARELGAATLKDATHVSGKRGVGPTTTTVSYFNVVDYAAAMVNSMQQFAVTLTSANTSDNQTITSVSTSDACILYGGVTVNSTGFNNITDWGYRLSLSAATTVAQARGGTNTGSRTLYYAVWEAPSGIFASMQRGTITMTSQTSNTGSISAVASGQAVANWLGFTMASAASLKGINASSIDLTNTTTLTTHMNTSNATANTVGYEVPEYSTGATNVNANPTGVSATGAVGDPSITADANVTPTGVAGTGAAGDVTIDLNTPVSVTGVAGTGAVGDPSITGDANVTPTGVAGTGSVGDPSITGDANVTPTGVEGTGQVGDPTVTLANVTYVDISATSLAIGTCTHPATFKKTVAATVVGVATCAHPAAFHKTLAATALAVATATEHATHRITAAATAVAVATEAGAMTLKHAVAATAVCIGTIKKSARKTLAATALCVPTIKKRAGKTLAATAHGTGTCAEMMTMAKVISVQAVVIATETEEFHAGTPKVLMDIIQQLIPFKR